jgi:thiamine biosynthesis lipoprotein
MRNLVIIIALAILIPACKQQEKLPLYLTGEAQGTYYAITYYDDQMRNLQHEVDSIFKAFDLSASVYLKESVISRVNRNDSSVLTDAVFDTVFMKAREVSEKTDGAFDITVMPLVNAWGFGFAKKSTVPMAVVDSLLNLVGYQKVTLANGKVIKENQAMMIDYNAIAQGYTSDLIGNFLESKGIVNYLIDVGGEVLGKGKKPDGNYWKVGIEKPAVDSVSTREIQTTVELKDKALATSGNYRKYYIEGGQKYSHTIDPKTGYPVRHSVLSVSVIADECMTADAYATAFMVMGLDKTKAFISQNKGLEVYVIFDENGKLQSWASDGFAKLQN